MVPLIIAAILVSGGGYFLYNHVGNPVEAITSNISEFITTRVWPSVLPTLRILPAYLLILIISHCDAFLKAGPRATSEALLANSVYYICWMCALYFVLKVLLDDILRIKAKKKDCFVIAVALALGVVLPSWETFGDDLVQLCSKLTYNVFCSIIILVILLLAIKYCKAPH